MIAYHRPTTIEEAVRRLNEPGVPKVVIGGGTVANTMHQEREVIDLQGLGLDQIRVDGDHVELGATVTLQELIEIPGFNPTLVELARREAPSTLRAAGTIGGLVATADPESELLAAFLVCDATVEIVGANGEGSVPLTRVLSEGLTGKIIESVHLQTSGDLGYERTARTPADRPIVAIVARRTDQGVRLAGCGLAATPVLVDDVDLLSPPSDFRGSSEYRLSLARVLTDRVRNDLR